MYPLPEKTGEPTAGSGGAARLQEMAQGVSKGAQAIVGTPDNLLICGLCVRGGVDLFCHRITSGLFAYVYSNFPTPDDTFPHVVDPPRPRNKRSVPGFASFLN